MAILGQVPKSELGSKYTHYGWFCGVCPVYVGALNSDAPVLAERNWVPEWCLALTDYLFGTYVMLRTSFDQDYEPMYPIAVGAEIK